MKSLYSPLRGLYWKEVRQVIPLVLMLVGVALLLVVLWTALQTTSGSTSTFGRYIPLILPALYAAGAGAILVGQEKETRTLLWFSSLPISPARIVVAKFVVALGGLIVMWVCCRLLGSLVGIAGPSGSSFMLTRGDETLSNSVYWFLHSVFILCCGFYTTWKLRNTFTSLLALIPLAVIPYLAVQLFYEVFQQRRYVSFSESAWMLSLATVLAIPVIGWLAYRAAIKNLSPDESESETHRSAQWLSAWRPARAVPTPELPFRYSISSLVWQSIHHNRWALGGLMVAMLLGTVGSACSINEEVMKRAGGFVGGSIVAGLVAVSWLGVFVFNGDGSAERLRFLADRGVSPSVAWVGRQLVGIGMLALATLLFTLLSFWFVRIEVDASNSPPFALSMATFALAVWVVYVVSQWTSQVIRIVAASAFVAPVFSAIAVYWLGWSVIELSTPVWLLLLTSTIPMLATWVMMRRFMDDNAKWPIWATGLVAAGLFAALPTVPFVIEIATWPKIAAGTRAKLVAEAMQLAPPPAQPQQMMWARSSDHDLPFGQELTQERALSVLAQRDYLPKSYIAIGDLDADSAVPLQADRYILGSCLSAADYFKVQFMGSPEDEQAMQSLGEWIETFASMAKRFRLSDRWLDQQAADLVEIWLTKTLSEPLLQPLHDREFAIAAMNVLADQASRSAARRRAVLATWREDSSPAVVTLRRRDAHSYEFGGLDKSSWFDWYSITKRNAIVRHSIDSLVATTIRFIEAGEAGQDTEGIRREMHALMWSPSIVFGDGPYADRMRVSGSADDAALHWYTLSFPASQWYATWEDDAKKLAQP